MGEGARHHARCDQQKQGSLCCRAAALPVGCRPCDRRCRTVLPMPARTSGNLATIHISVDPGRLSGAQDPGRPTLSRLGLTRWRYPPCERL